MTDWRTIGPVHKAMWDRELFQAKSPLYAVKDEAYEAAGNHSALALAMMREESTYGTDFNRNVAGNRNVLNLRPPLGNGYLEFGGWVDGVRAWHDRLLDPAYKGGIYARTRTIAELIHVYAPSSDNNDEQAYVAGIEQSLLRWGVTPQEVQPMSELVFGRVPKPAMVPNMICPKPYDGAGFTRLASPRQPVGICEHITAGHGSVEFYHDFFSTGGERANDALVDFIVGRDGRIGMLNDPWGTRAPWANGNTRGLEGDGAAFLARFGVAGVNDRLVSIEHEGHAYEDWTPEQWNASVALDAWLLDQMGVRHDSFPVHQGFGVVTHMLHSEFTDKGGNYLDECPGRYLKQNITGFQSDVRAIMMAHQVSPEPVPAPEPVVVPGPISWNPGDTGIKMLNGTKVYALKARVTCKKLTTARVSASTKSKSCGKVEPNQEVEVIGTLDSPWYFWDKGDGTYPRIHRNYFYPRLPRPQDAS